MASLFISYSRKDIETARKLTQSFSGQDLDFWIDWEGIPPTVDWWREIERGIEQADIFLFLISPDSARSKVCRKEIDHAAKNGKRLIPVVVRDLKADESPTKLRPLNWIFLRENDDFKAGFKSLITAIKTDYEWVQAHRQLQVKALEWERSTKENSFLLRGKELQDAEFQLATNSSKQPNPTDLQREYVLKSRLVTDRQRGTTTGIAVAGLVIVAALAVYGFVQAKLATDRANSALARQLAAQSQVVIATRNSKQFLAVLLAVQSMKISPSLEGSQILLNNNVAASLIAQMTHESGVATVGFSSDGKYVVSGSGDNTARVWEALTGKEVARMTHEDTVISVAFSPDGKYVVSGSADDTARVWEIATGNEVARMTHDGIVVLVAFSPDGKYVVSGGDKTARVWATLTGKEVARMTYENSLRSAAFSPDGKYVVSGGCDEVEAGQPCRQGSARVWETTSGKEVARMTHKGDVSSVAFSPDGKYVVSGSLGFDDTARIWEAFTGKELTRMIHNAPVYDVAFSPDGKYVVSGCGDNIARVWEVATGKEVAHMTHDDIVWVVAFSPDGKYVISGGFGLDSTARIWETLTGREVARMTHDNAVYDVAFSPDGKYAASGSVDATARVWETASKKEVARMTYDNGVSSVAFSPDGKYVVSRSADYTARVSETATGKEVARMTSVVSVALSPDGKYVVSGSYDDTVRLWEALTGKEVTHMTHDDVVVFVAFSPDSKYIVSSSYDHTARVWETVSGKEVARMTYEGDVSSVAFSPDGTHAVAAGCDEAESSAQPCRKGSARVWEIATGKEVARMTHEGTVNLVAFSPDGEYLISSGSEDHNVRVWEAATGKEVARMTHEGAVSSIAFSPDGTYVISAGCDEAESSAQSCRKGSARVWEAATAKEVARMTNYRGVASLVFPSFFFSFVGFSPDGKYVVSGSSDHTIRVWEAATGKEVARMTHDDVVLVVALSPDGRYVVSGSVDNTARVWETATGREVARMVHGNLVSQVAFSPDSKYVVTGSWDGTARVWVWQSEDVIAKACAYLPRNLTPTEWNQYIGDAMPYQAVCPNLPIEHETIATPTPTP